MVTSKSSSALKWTFENNAVVIKLDNVIARDYLKEQGRTGFGVAPTKLITRDGAAGGTRWRRTRRGARNIVMPVLIFGDTRQSVEDKLRALIRLLQDDVTTPRLVATYPSGERVYADIHYSSGADPTYGTDTDGTSWCRWALNFLGPSAYWTSEKQISYSIGTASIGRGLLRTGQSLSRLSLSSSQALGTVLVENPGDVDAYPIWNIKGPGDSFTATLPDGTGFVYNVPILSTEVITINTKDKTVKDQTGANRYAALSTAPNLFSVPKGNTNIAVLMTGTTAASLVSMYFNPRQELIF